MAELEVQFVEISGGHVLPANKIVCPHCKALVLGTVVDTTKETWMGHCPRGHSFSIEHHPDA